MSDSAGTASAARGDGGPGPGGSARTGSRRDGGPGRIRSIGVFFRQVVAELRKVIWPSRQDLVTYTSVVLVFVVAMVVIVSIFDFAFAKAVLAVFGGTPDPAS